MDLDDYDVVEVPQPEGSANDTDPMWIGDTLYFTSDRDGEFNLYRFAIKATPNADLWCRHKASIR